MTEENKIICVCPYCASDDIEFLIWWNPNDTTSTAHELDRNGAGIDQRGYCHRCEKDIKYCDEVQKKNINQII